MASKLGLYNAALRLIGEQKLASLEEERKPRRVLDDVYSEACLYCLEQGYWDFAIRSIAANSVPSVNPTFGYQYAFTKPDDWLRTSALYSDSSETTTLLEYSFEQGYLYANVDPVYWRYISSDAQYGMDIGKWTTTFTKYVEAHLAAEIVEEITQNQTKSQEMRLLEKDRLRNAKNKDAMEDAVRFPPNGSWVLSRTGWRMGGSSLRGTRRGL